MFRYLTEFKFVLEILPKMALTANVRKGRFKTHHYVKTFLGL